MSIHAAPIGPSRPASLETRGEKTRDVLQCLLQLLTPIVLQKIHTKQQHWSGHGPRVELASSHLQEQAERPTGPMALSVGVGDKAQ